MEEERPFGAVLARSTNPETGEREPYMVGTAMRIVHLASTSDGDVDVQVLGERRFRIRQLDESGPLLKGLVEPVIEIDPEDDPNIGLLSSQTKDEFKRYIEGLLPNEEFNIQVHLPSDPIASSFLIANLLPVENLAKQRLLELTDTAERLSEILPILQTQRKQTAPRAYQRLTAQDFEAFQNLN